MEWGLCCVFDYDVNSTASEVKTPVRCTPSSVLREHPASGDLLLNFQEASNLKGNWLYRALFKTAYFTC